MRRQSTVDFVGVVKKLKAYRIVTYITDFEDVGLDEILFLLLPTKYLSTQIGAISEIDIGEWDDDHPLN